MSADSSKAYTLFIETGFHAGTVQRLSSGIYTLGSELDADVVLSDEAIAPIHLIIELDRQNLRLEPLQGTITVRGESTELEPGGERYLTLPTSFAIGDVDIKLTAPEDVVRTRQRVRLAAAALGVALIGAIGLQVFGPSSGSAPTKPGELASLSMPAADEGPEMAAEPVDQVIGQPGDQPAEMSKGADMGADKADDTNRTPDDVTLEQASAELRARLIAASLSDIEVDASTDRIVVRGAALPSRMTDWQEIRIWFDGAYGQKFLMVADVEPAEDQKPPKLAIEAVWSGKDPYLVAGGQRFFEGAPIGDGWMVDRIQSDAITFKRGDKSFSLTL